MCKIHFIETILHRSTRYLQEYKDDNQWHQQNFRQSSQSQDV